MCFFESSGDHRDLHGLTHSFPTRRSADLHCVRADAAPPARACRMKAPDVAMEGGGRRGRSAADRRPAASALLEFRDTIGPWPPPAYVVVRFRRVDRRSTTRVWQPMPLLPRSRPEEPTDMTEEAGPGDAIPLVAAFGLLHQRAEPGSVAVVLQCATGGQRIGVRAFEQLGEIVARVRQDRAIKPEIGGAHV